MASNYKSLVDMLQTDIPLGKRKRILEILLDMTNKELEENQAFSPKQYIRRQSLQATTAQSTQSVQYKALDRQSSPVDEFALESRLLAEAKTTGDRGAIEYQRDTGFMVPNSDTSTNLDSQLADIQSLYTMIMKEKEDRHKKRSINKTQK
jgi:hypothetical protein